MSNTYITADETEAFLAANPGVTWIDLILFDINGIPRGKRFRRSRLHGICNGENARNAAVDAHEDRRQGGEQGERA